MLDEFRGYSTLLDVFFEMQATKSPSRPRIPAYDGILVMGATKAWERIGLWTTCSRGGHLSSVDQEAMTSVPGRFHTMRFSPLARRRPIPSPKMTTCCSVFTAT